MKNLPDIAEVSPLDSYKLSLKFTDGKKAVYDCSDMLEFGVFSELKNIGYFNMVKVSDGTVVWPNGQDISPDTLYIEASRV